MLIDTHLHLINEGFDITKVIENANKNDVKKLIVSGASLEDNFLNIEKLSKYKNIYFSCGYHPEFACVVTEKDYLKLEKLINNKKVVAIGEIGLDYHYSKENKEEQKVMFRRQLDLANKHNLPVVIHTRDAVFDTINILSEYNLKGVIHCFSGSLETAKQYISMGYYLGIGGVVTFKNSNLKEVLKEIGIENIVFETDSPYLSPFRGEKNEPCNVKVIAEFISDYLGLSIEEVKAITTKNAESIFNI